MERARRRVVLDRFFEILRAEAAEHEVDVDEKLDLIFEYQEGFEAAPLSRCPITQQLASFAIDSIDLDGLWWNWGAPVRGDDDVPDTYFALSGAMRLSGAIAPAPFVCRPGPDVPFVVPRMLAVEGVVAVVSTVGIGPHQGYPIVYFSQGSPVTARRVNDWGSSRYYARTDDGFDRHYEPEDVGEYDFDLAPWIRAGKLWWIPPGDEALQLRQSAEECPYLDLRGRREIPVIVDGRVVWDDEKTKD